MTHPSKLLNFVAAIAIMLSSHAIAAENENLFSQISTETRLNSMIQQVISAMNAKKFDQALGIIDEAQKLSPEDPTLRNARAAVFMQTDRFDEAAVILKSLLDENPKFFQADYNLGEISFLQGRYADARRHFERLRTVYGDVPLIRFKLLLCELMDGDQTAAEIRIRSFRFPTDAPVWYFAHAAMAKNRGDDREARRLMDVATEIHGEDATSLFSETIETSFSKK